MAHTRKNHAYSYDVIVDLQNRRLEEFIQTNYDRLSRFVGKLKWRDSEQLVTVLRMTWNKEHHSKSTHAEIGRAGETNLDAYVDGTTIVFHFYPDAGDPDWTWQYQERYHQRLQSEAFQQSQYELAQRLAKLLV